MCSCSQCECSYSDHTCSFQRRHSDRSDDPVDRGRIAGVRQQVFPAVWKDTRLPGAYSTNFSNITYTCL
jgi:hypothetical protein